MFVLKSTYQTLVIRYLSLEAKWNTLVADINSKGGELFLQSNPFVYDLTEDDINKLIFLCHPDKHDNSVKSTDITAKLLSIKEKI